MIWVITGCAGTNIPESKGFPFFAQVSCHKEGVSKIRERTWFPAPGLRSEFVMNKVLKKMFIKTTLIFLVMGVLLAPLSGVSGVEKEPELVKIGVLAKRGPEVALKKWGPTAEYLDENLPGYTFEVVPLEYDQVYPSVENKEVDFILANVQFYVGLELRFGASRLVTLKNLSLGEGYTEYAGVVITRSDRDDIRNYSDLKGKRFVTLHETAFASWPAVWYEMEEEQGFDPYTELGELTFRSSMDEVVFAVRDGEADAGSIRSDLLERMAIEGKIRLEDFRVLYEGHEPGTCKDMPFLHSTRCYPEWPLAKTRHVNNQLAEDVSHLLIELEPDHPAAIAAKVTGWTFPHNYQPVHETLRTLKINPYEDYGKVTVGDALRQFWPTIAGSATLFIGLFTAYLLQVNRRLKKAVVSQEEEIVERRKVEQKQKILTTELEKKNAELERFTYTVSHDLKSPLITISGFLGLLDKDANDGDFVRMRGNMKKIFSATEKMHVLLGDLLELSRIGRLVNPSEEVYLDKLANEIVNQLEKNIKDLGIHVEINPELPVAFGDHQRLLEVFQNLIENAMKFMGDQQEPRIEIGTKKSGSETICYVRDNGIGIDAKFHNKVFDLFSRLDADIEGTGVGLAIVKQIIELHGGRVWVESEGDGKGSTFCFIISSSHALRGNEKGKEKGYYEKKRS